MPHLVAATAWFSSSAGPPACHFARRRQVCEAMITTPAAGLRPSTATRSGSHKAGPASYHTESGDKQKVWTLLRLRLRRAGEAMLASEVDAWLVGL